MSIQAGRTIKIIVVDDEPISADDMSDVIRDEFGKSMNVDEMFVRRTMLKAS